MGKNPRISLLPLLVLAFVAALVSEPPQNPSKNPCQAPNPPNYLKINDIRVA
jgi:hypothetical protein